MKRELALILGLAAVAVGCVTAPQYACGKYEGAAAKVAPKHVIFIGWDGFAGNTVAAAQIPTLRKVMDEGAWTVHSRSILPSSSACNWHSLFTCSASEQHGFNSWDCKAPVFPPAALAENGLYPDILHELRRQRPDATIGFIYEWGGMAFVADTNACDYVKATDWNKLTADAIRYIREKKPTFLAVCHDSPDHHGHSHGWGSPQYYERVTLLDSELKQVLTAIEEAGILEDTVVVLSSDHGGVDKKHGGATLAQMERPVFIWGKDVKRGYELKFPGTVYDTGATLAALLGIKPPSCWIGRPFDEAFRND